MESKECFRRQYLLYTGILFLCLIIGAICLYTRVNYGYEPVNKKSYEAAVLAEQGYNDTLINLRAKLEELTGEETKVRIAKGDISQIKLQKQSIQENISTIISDKKDLRDDKKMKDTPAGNWATFALIVAGTVALAIFPRTVFSSLMSKD